MQPLIFPVICLLLTSCSKSENFQSTAKHPTATPLTVSNFGTGQRENLPAAEHHITTVTDNQVTNSSTTSTTTTVPPETILPKTEEDSTVPKDRTVYVNLPGEGRLVILRDIASYVPLHEANNYSLVTLDEHDGHFHFTHFASLPEFLESDSKDFEVKFGQKVLLYNSILNFFEFWWIIKNCSELPFHFNTKCRVVPLDSRNRTISIPSGDTPTAILFQNIHNLTLENVSCSGVPQDDTRCYHKIGENSLDSCSSLAIGYIVMNVSSDFSCDVFPKSSTEPIRITFKVWNVSYLLSIQPDYRPITIDLLRESTPLLIQMNSSLIHKIDSCSTIGGGDSKRLCVSTNDNRKIRVGIGRTLLEGQFIRMNIMKSRNATYFVNYFTAKDGKTGTQRIETWDKKYMRYPCFNASVVGCTRITALNSESGCFVAADNEINKHDGDVEQDILICNSGDLIILCPHRRAEVSLNYLDTYLDNTVTEDSDTLGLELPVIVSLMVLTVLFLLGFLAYRLKIQKQKAQYHTYVEPQHIEHFMETDHKIEVLYD